MKKIIVKLETENLELILLEDASEIDKASFYDLKNLSDSLLIKIDEFLKKNNLTLSDINKFDLQTDISDKFTSVKIADVIVRTLNLGKDVD